MREVLLVNMPFAHLRWPNLGPSLLKAALASRSVRCQVAYFNYDFAERVGLERYNWIADQWAFVLGGERLFARHFFGSQLPDDEAYLRQVVQAADPELSADEWRDYQAVAGQVPDFLDHVAASRNWSRYAVVGFAATFQQTMASVCLAQRIKERHPEVRIVFGGAACEGEMGVELLRQFPVIDYVFLGEADRTFPLLVEQILAGGPAHAPPGVVDRRSLSAPRLAVDEPRGRVWQSDSAMVLDMDALPYPDFDDYFARWRSSPLRDEIDPLLFFETSRGCWWGEKHHCLFCGLNGSRLTYRSKTPGRVVDELRFLTGRHGCRRACAADNIFDHRYFKTLLPRLKAAQLDLAFVYELKPNLTRRQVQMLLDAGLGAAQLGIETFSTPILRQIRKGATAVHNLQALKWFSEAGVEVKWNLLYGFPGEDPGEYRAMAELLPSLFHLAPPLAIGQVRMDRFAPYFEDPQAHGLARPRASRAFRFVFPFAPAVLDRLAYHYDYDYADGRDPRKYAAPVIEAARQWQRLAGTVALRQYDRPDGVLILTDTRPTAETWQTRLVGLDRLVYLFCDEARSFKAISEYAQSHTGDAAPDEATLREKLDRWVAQRLMAHIDGRYLSLALG